MVIAWMVVVCLVANQGIKSKYEVGKDVASNPKMTETDYLNDGYGKQDERF